MSPQGDLTIGGQTVAAGTRAVVRMPITTGLNGAELALFAHVVRGSEDGPVLVLLSGLHGGEWFSIETFRRLVLGTDPRTLRGTLIALPTIPFVTPPLLPPDASIEDDMAASLDMIGNTCPFNLSGHPAISVPCGMTEELPIGLMLVGRRFDDLTVLQAADAVEKSGDWQKR